MSHSRNRRPSRTSEPARKAPADYMTNNGNGNGGTKDRIKIPRNVRYDLENALLGLCDVWFEEIKPHLIKNNLKLHTGGALSENGAELEPAIEPRWDSRHQLDQGAASDTRHRVAANSRAYSLTQPAASKAPCPNLKPPLRTRPISPTNFCKLLQLPDNEKKRPPAPVRSVPEPEHSPPITKNYQRNVHNSSKKREQLPVQKRSLKKSPPPAQTLQRNVPSSTKLKAPQRGSSSPSTQTYQPKIYMSSKQKASSDRKNRKSSRTRIMKLIPSSRFSNPNRVSRPRCIACALAKEQTQQTNAIPQQSRAIRTERLRAKSTSLKCADKTGNFSLPKCQKTSVPTQESGDLPLSLQPSGGYTRHNHPSTATSKHRRKRKSPFSLRHASVLPSPLHAKCIAPPEHPIALSRENQPVSTILSPEPSSDEMWFHRVFKEHTRPQNHRIPPTTEHTVDKRRSSKHTIPINNENKLLFEDENPLFSKDLIDLIGDKNDERLRVLYENPTRQELQQSIMCLAGARKKRIKNKPKKIPWR